MRERTSHTNMTEHEVAEHSQTHIEVHYHPCEHKHMHTRCLCNGTIWQNSLIFKICIINTERPPTNKQTNNWFNVSLQSMHFFMWICISNSWFQLIITRTILHWVLWPVFRPQWQEMFLLGNSPPLYAN